MRLTNARCRQFIGEVVSKDSNSAKGTRAWEVQRRPCKTVSLLVEVGLNSFRL